MRQLDLILKIITLSILRQRVLQKYNKQMRFIEKRINS